MTSSEFKDLLTRAVAGDKESVGKILIMYEALINNNSIINGRFDEDLKQYISLRIIKKISKFDIDKKS